MTTTHAIVQRLRSADMWVALRSGGSETIESAPFEAANLIEAQSAEIEKLRAALDPFARVARIQGPISADWSRDKPNIEFIPSVWPDWGDFADARTLLETEHGNG